MRTTIDIPDPVYEKKRKRVDLVDFVDLGKGWFQYQDIRHAFEIIT